MKPFDLEAAKRGEPIQTRDDRLGGKARPIVIEERGMLHNIREYLMRHHNDLLDAALYATYALAAVVLVLAVKGG